MSQKGHVSIRTCVGCREKKKKKEMIWLTHGGAGVAVVNGKKPHRGRGFYLCSERCLGLAKKRKKGPVGLEVADFRFPSAGDLGREQGFGIREVRDDKE